MYTLYVGQTSELFSKWITQLSSGQQFLRSFTTKTTVIPSVVEFYNVVLVSTQDSLCTYPSLYVEKIRVATRQYNTKLEFGFRGIEYTLIL